MPIFLSRWGRIWKYRLVSILFTISLPFQHPLAVAQSSAPAFALHDGDRVALYGDSITEQRKYSAEVEMFVLTRFPKANILFHGIGVGGDRVSGGYMGPVDLRLDRDLIAWHPTVITIMLGMNDGYYRADEPGIYRTYTEGMNHILDRIKSEVPAARVTLIGPSAYDDVTRDPLFAGGYNSVLQRYGSYLQDAARKNDFGFTDFNAPLVDLLKKTKADNLEIAQMLIPDRMHPAEGATWIMAESLLKSWNAPSLVSSVTLDGGVGTPGPVQNATVTAVRKTKQGLQWDCREDALPLPFYSPKIDPVVAAALQHSDVVASLDNEMLTVRGLTRKHYDLIIDGYKIDTFTNEQLATGVNLALMETPMLQQARLVGVETDKKNGLEQSLMNSLYPSLADETSARTEMLRKLLDAATIQQRADAQTRTHHFELSAVAE